MVRITYLLRNDPYFIFADLDFRSEGTDCAGVESAFLVEEIGEIEDEVDPLIDINALIVGGVEEGDDIVNILFWDATFLAVRLREVSVRSL